MKILTLIFCFCIISINAQTNLLLNTSNQKNESKVKENTNTSIGNMQVFLTPRETMSFFLNAMEKYKKGDSKAINQAILAFDLSEYAPSTRGTIGKIVAERLINTIDRIQEINLESLPSYVDGPPWYFRKQTVNVNDKPHDVEIGIGKDLNGNFLFTKETIRTVEFFYLSVAHLPTITGVFSSKSTLFHLKSLLPKWSLNKVFLLENWQWGAILFLILCSFLTMYIVRYIALIYARRFLEEQRLYRSTKAFGVLAFFIVFHIGIKFLDLNLEVLEFILRGSYIAITFSSVWTLLKVVDFFSAMFFEKAKKTENKFDDVLVPLLSKTAKVVVISFGALFVAHSLTFDIGSILAGLGIGGVAVALAAKDTISNLFGSVTVILDRPFHVGDLILLDKGIEGSVEQVGFRSTRLRTPYNSLVTMPNSLLANMAIDNYGMRKLRRFKTSIKLEISNPIEKVEEFINQVRYAIQLHPLIEKESVNNIVALHEINENSLNIQIIVYFNTQSGVVEIDERHKFILEMLKIAKGLNLDFFSPTQNNFTRNLNQ